MGVFRNLVKPGSRSFCGKLAAGAPRTVRRVGTEQIGAKRLKARHYFSGRACVSFGRAGRLRRRSIGRRLRDLVLSVRKAPGRRVSIVPWNRSSLRLSFDLYTRRRTCRRSGIVRRRAAILLRPGSHPTKSRQSRIGPVSQGHDRPGGVEGKSQWKVCLGVWAVGA
jgi:hypothetical protein